jgi:GR25 family glycosyltransferase involved in LPS biosynthesis
MTQVVERPSFLLSAESVDELIVQTRAATHGMPRRAALSLWQNIVRRFADEPRLARQYLYELSLGDAWDEIARLTPEFERYADREIDMALLTISAERLLLDIADRRLADLVSRYGVAADTMLAAYDIAMLRRDHSGAIAQSQKLRATSREHRQLGRTLEAKARFYQKLDQRASTSAKQRDFDIVVINLDADTARLERMVRQSALGSWDRLSAVKGSYLPDHALRLLTHGAGHDLRGTVGCFLSHVKVWERVAATERHALVLEDDACLLCPVPPSLASLNLPVDYHLCFVNERMLDPDYRYTDTRFGVVSVETLARSKPADWGSAGTDGYLISPAGARALLELIAVDGIAGDVDWRLVSYGLPQRLRAHFASMQGPFANAIRFHERFRDEQMLRIYSLYPSLVRQFRGGSVRLWDNAMLPDHAAELAEAKRRPR